MIVPARIESASSARVRSAMPDIQRALSFVQAGRPFDAEPDRERRIANAANLLSVSREAAEDLLAHGREADQPLPAATWKMAEAIQGDTVDWQPVGWLRWALKASRSVVRILKADKGWGTGFLISEDLILTNNHVLPNPIEAQNMLVEFDYELDEDSAPRPTSRYRLRPEAFFVTDGRDDLDFTIVAAGDPVGQSAPLRAFGACFLSASGAKHAIGNHVTIVQHPNGGQKLIVFRENRILHRGQTVLHYTADTEPGSSGSPVFNDRFQVVALHHWGGPHRELRDSDGALLKSDVNEGIRVSAIVEEVANRRASLPQSQRELLDGALREPRQPLVSDTPADPIEDDSATATAAPRLRKEFPMSAEAAIIDPDFSSRQGYEPRFLGRRFEVPLPRLADAQRRIAARVRGLGDANQYVLPYHHFSICMNGRDRLAFYTAVNIYGPSWKNVDRDSGLVLDEAAEARERWYMDERIPPATQADDSLYLNQNTRRRYFQRGHLVRRLDPTWGSKRIAEFANGDTFHFTNCAPQARGFNDAKNRWAGIEDYVLYTARALGDRISVYSGPILSGKDPIWRGIRIPLRYFKIVARVEDGELVATALIADQGEQVREILSSEEARAPEAYDEWANMPTAIREYHRSVAEVESLTGLDFGPLREADRPGNSEEALPSVEMDNRDSLEGVLDAGPPKPKSVGRSRPRPRRVRR